MFLRYTQRKFLTVAILVALTLPLCGVRAETSDTEDMRFQLQAIVNYLERLTGQYATSPLSDEDMQLVVEDGVEWFVSAQEENGHFAYEYLPYQDQYLDDDNEVRQAGSLYVLAEVFRHQTEKDPQLAETIEKSIAYFLSLTSHTDDFSCVLRSQRSSRCRLGTTSLVLLGLLSYVDGDPEKISKYGETITAYKNYITASRITDAGFSSEFHTHDDTFNDSESPFFNGEAMLALARYYQYDQDPVVAAMAKEIFSYLSEQPYDSALYLWIMAALKEMNVLWPSDEQVTYAKEFTNWRVDQVSYRRETDRNYCAYIEGVTSAYSVLEASVTDGEKTELQAEIDFWLHKSASLQLGESDLYRVVENQNGGLVLVKISAPELAIGGFLTAHSNLTQRIDFTQHCLSAYVQTLVDVRGSAL